MRLATLSRWSRGLAAAALLSSTTAAAQVPNTIQGQDVTAQDRAEIQALVTAYARALGGCAADQFADLFAPGTGYFASGIRGQVVGRDRLLALVQSERHCVTPPAAPAARPGGSAGPTASVEMTPTGVRGVADLGGAGRYEDEYVKTPKGWRFAARTVVTPAERAAGLDAREMVAIRQLAGAEGEVDDFYVPGQDGVRRFRTSGVAIGVSNGIVTGRAYLKDGGFYDDVYEKTAQGRWRFKSRTFVSQSTAAASTALQALSALDYFEIQQLVSKYARYIDTCSNNGYDYADLFAADGYFAPSQDGKVGRKFQGREQLAEVSGGGSRGCKNVGWIVQGVKHMYVNHIITPSVEGATGTVDMLMIGLNNDPYRIRHEGYYEDTYVKTAQGWRFKSRIHHVPPPTPAPAATAPAPQR
jgi:hypothetical protein